MATGKTDLFNRKLNSTAALFKSLSHPARLSILQYLAETRVCITGDLSNELPLSRTTVKQHLIELKKARLIRGTVDGVRVNYCLDPKGILELGRIFNDFFDLINQPGNNNCNHT
jgi:ArsR family transcriptional regulator